MKSKLFLNLLFVLALVAMLSGNPGIAQAEGACDAAFVSQAGNVITVSPTGLDDTANLQCAFDAALVVGPGAHVALTAGIFHTGQITAHNFDGTFSGQGMEDTTITNLPNLYVTPQDFYLEPPSPANPWPALFAFVDGKIAIADLAILVKGSAPTTGWSFFGIEPPPTELALAIAILGTQADARAERILIEGEAMENSLYGYNLINGIYFEGFMGEFPWPPISGTFEVVDSTFRHLGSPVPVLNTIDSTILVSHNTMQDVFDATDASAIINTQMTVSHNQVEDALFGFWMYGDPTNANSSLLVKNNTYRTTYGVMMTNSPGGECLILGNNLQLTTDIGVFFDEYVSGCTVVGGSNKTNVLDLGSDNTLVGVTKLQAGVGPILQPFMKP